MPVIQQPTSPTFTRVEQLPFYRRLPIVPIPSPLEPIQSFRGRTTFPRLPTEHFSTSTSKSWYFTRVGINPGLHRATWEEYRANIEAHLGLPEPYCPHYYRVEGRLPPQLARLTVLPPPPRPEVLLNAPHFWVVYVGRVPGVYDDMYVFFFFRCFLYQRLWLVIIFASYFVGAFFSENGLSLSISEMRFKTKFAGCKVPGWRYFHLVKRPLDGIGTDGLKDLWLR